MIVKEYSLFNNSERRPELALKKEHQVAEKLVLNTPKVTYEFAREKLKMKQLAEEYIYIIGTDSGMVPKGVCQVAHGSMDDCFIDMKAIMTRLLLMGASRFIMLHNHPSGDPKPSNMDIEMTYIARQVGQLMDIPLVDHIIVGDELYSIFGSIDLDTAKN